MFDGRYGIIQALSKGGVFSDFLEEVGDFLLVNVEKRRYTNDPTAVVRQFFLPCPLMSLR